MMSKKRNIVIATVVTVFCFFTMLWVSCDKPVKTTLNCGVLVCENGGECHDTVGAKAPYCTCPTGYSGYNCATGVANKFYGSWVLQQHVDGSDSTQYNGMNTAYTVSLAKTATSTTFFINNFFNQEFYDNIVCDIDSVDANYFTIDTNSNYHMQNDHYQILPYGYGRISPSGDQISMYMRIRFKNQTSNWQRDTLTLTLTQRH